MSNIINTNSNYSNIRNSIEKEKTPKFESLSYGTLRRYQAFFNIKDESKTQDREKIANLLKNHFNNLEVDTDRVLESFMKIEKDQNCEKNNALRISTRNQEKNMRKFLDNFVNNK
jgi:hypothetical protein